MVIIFYRISKIATSAFLFALIVMLFGCTTMVKHESEQNFNYKSHLERGDIVDIKKKDGVLVRGEVYSLDDDSIIILIKSGVDATVKYSDISTLKVESKLIKNAGIVAAVPIVSVYTVVMYSLTAVKLMACFVVFVAGFETECLTS